MWYLSPGFILAILTISMTIDSLHEWSRRVLPDARTLRVSLASLGVALVMIPSAYGYITLLTDRTEENSLYSRRYQLARRLDRQLEPHAILAAFNAGQLGFFSHRTVINLDGLVNNIDFYLRYVIGKDSVAGYLGTQRVDYFVDYNVPDDVRSLGAVIDHVGADRTKVIEVIKLRKTFAPAGAKQ